MTLLECGSASCRFLCRSASCGGGGGWRLRIESGSWRCRTPDYIALILVISPATTSVAFAFWVTLQFSG